MTDEARVNDLSKRIAKMAVKEPIDVSIMSLCMILGLYANKHPQYSQSINHLLQQYATMDTTMNSDGREDA